MKLQYLVGCILAADSSLVFPQLGLVHGGGGRGQGFGGYSLSQGLSGARGFAGRGRTGRGETTRIVG